MPLQRPLSCILFEGDEHLMAAETTNKGRKKPKNEGNALTRPFNGIREYMQEVQQELNKVTWPTRPEVIRLTRVVLIVTIIFAIVLGSLSFLLSIFIREGLSQPILLLAAFVAIVGGTLYWLRRSDTRRSY